MTKSLYRDNQTNPYGDKGQMYAATHPGMAAWAGSGPEGKTCRECKSFQSAGHYSVSGKHQGGLKPGICAEHAKYMGKKGPAFPYYALACGKFDQSDNPPSIAVTSLWER